MNVHVAVTGASGFIGSALVPVLSSAGHRVSRLVRRAVVAHEAEIPWDPVAGRLDPARLEHVDAVIHLAGENIAAGRWTEKRKASIRESRVGATRLLAGTLARLAHPPRVLLSASAIGFYGDRGDEVLDEGSQSGTGFLADVCRAWEAETEPAEKAGIRVVGLRFGLILSAAGGALPRLLTPFRLGLGGRVGTGRAWMSWVALDDVVSAIHFALLASTLSGPVNVVAPAPVRNVELARTLGRVLRRPSSVPLPAVMVRLLFGQMGRELLLAGQRVVPRRLLDAGFDFRHEDLDGALRFELGSPKR